MRNKIVFMVFLVLSFNIQAAPDLVKKQVTIQIISGTYIGETGNATVIYDNSKAKGVGKESIKDADVSFKFLNQTVDGKAEVVLNDGKFENLLWVASIKNPQGKSFNFGFNSGFSRWQFNRPTEAFINEGKNYFGYLFPNTYVDGAGTVTYSD